MTGGVETASREVGLRPEEAACLAAEVLAYEFTATSRDPLQPTAYACDLGNGTWLVRYERGASGPYLPRANGHFQRERPAADGEIRGAPPLGRIHFVAGPPVAPGNPILDCVSVEIAPDGAGHCRLRASGRDESRAAALFGLLGFVADLKHAHEMVRTGQLEAARQELVTLTGAHRLGFSSIHDPLLAQAWALAARLDLETGHPEEARRSLLQARLLAPDAAQLVLLAARLHERFAELEQAKQALVEAADLGGGDAWSRAVAFVARGVEPPDSVEERFRAAIERSAQALLRQDAAGAAAWANRALDAQPGSSEGLSRLADAVEAQGQAREARDLRLMALQSRPAASAELLRALARDDARHDPALALRTALRRADHWPELLGEPSVLKSAGALGWERTLRLLRSEGFGRAAGPLAQRAAAGDEEPRRAFVNQLLTLFAPQRLPRPEEPASVQAEPAFGASGLAVPPH